MDDIAFTAHDWISFDDLHASRCWDAGDVMSALRHATEQRQRSLENAPLSRRVMSDSSTHADVAALLRAHLAVLRPWSKACPVAVWSISDQSPMHRVLALHRDLDALAACWYDLENDAALPLAWHAEHAAWYGAFHALEESRIGTRLIAARLRQTFGGQLKGAMRFLSPAGEASPLIDRPGMQLRIAARLRNDADLQAAIEGARWMFDALHHALRGESDVGVEHDAPRTAHRVSQAAA